MGSSNRDYMQEDDETRGPSWAHDVPTTKWLLIVSVATFFLQTLLTHDFVIPDQGGPQRVASVSLIHLDESRPLVTPVAFRGMMPQVSYVEEWFSLEANKVLHGQVWRLVTFVFCHHRFNPLGLVFNMIGLWFLGSCLERMYGSREILWFYLTSAAVCGVIFTAFGLKMDLPDPLMGAGPCVMALLTLYATHFPRQEFLFCFLVPIQVQVLLWIYVALDLYWIVQASSTPSVWIVVAYTAEIWNILFAYLYRRMNWRLSAIAELLDLRKIQKSMRRVTTARTLKVFQPEPMTNLDEQVDAILAKIHERGSESLTDRERSILQKASEQAKNRL